jgi:hypothetical protein
MTNYCIHRDLLCRIAINNIDNDNELIKQTQMCTSQNGVFYSNDTNSNSNVKMLDDETQQKFNNYPYCLEDTAPFVLSNPNTNHSYLDDKMIVETIKKDNMKDFMILLNQNPNRQMNEQLNYGYTGNTILHEAIYWNANSILNYLLKNVCQETLKATNIDKNTVLHIATLKQLDWVVHILQKNYPIVNAFSNFNAKGDSPFLCAIRTGSETLVRLYLELCDLNIIYERNSLNHMNSLHIAVTTPNQNLNIIKILVKHGVDMIDKCANKKGDETTGSIIETTLRPICSKPTKSILENLQMSPRTPLNLEIETYLIREFYKFHTNNSDKSTYEEAVKLHPEYSSFDCVHNGIHIDIEYDNKLNDNDLYRPMNQTALKVLPQNLKKDFIRDI